MARLRDEFDQFTKRDAMILALGPNSPMAFEQYWMNEKIPFIGLPDPDHRVAKMYRQEVKIFKLGRMPLSCIIDAKGYVRFAHYGESMRDIPSNAELFQVIDALNKTSA
ncbi:MAG: redoxin domain-containing protein [Anaerolineales bacterium]|nr:redoxin domain-containing protein [Anaerolineales bacterium]